MTGDESGSPERPTAAEFSGLAIALIWAALHTLSGFAESMGVLLFFANGWVVCVYATLIGLSRMHSTRVAVGSGAIVVLGLTHFAWLVPSTMVMLALTRLVLPSGWVDEDSLMLLATGLLFAMVIVVMAPSLVISALILGCVAASYLLGQHRFEMAISMLHVGIGASLFLTVLRDRPIEPGNCSRCGYSLAGLPMSTRCPECGSRPERAQDPSPPKSRLS